MIIRLLLLLSLVFVFVHSGIGAGKTDTQKTQVLVVGTIHQLHATDSSYTYKDLVGFLSTYNPDVICVEIRPSEFRRKSYLAEMVLATIWGTVHDRKVYPIDWFHDDIRQIRDSLMQIPEYQQREKELEALHAKDSIIGNFEKQYGTWADQHQNGYAFWNGREYNDYIAERYRLSMSVFGDSPYNLYYQSRNDSMAALILGAIGENPGRKVVVFTGAEHKHYFDRALQRHPGVTVVDATSLFPLAKKELDPAITSYLDDLNDLPYFAKGYPDDMNSYYRIKLIPLIHGPKMDFMPEIIPVENVVKAARVVDRWKNDPAAPTAADMIDGDLGWIRFLQGDYRAAIAVLSPLSARIDAGSVNDPALRLTAKRTLGFSYDMVGEREKAIACYTRGEELARGTAYEGAIPLLFKDYKTVPYRR